MKKLTFRFYRLPKFTDQTKWRLGVERDIQDIDPEFSTNWHLALDMDQILEVDIKESSSEMVYIIMHNVHGALLVN